MKLNTNLPGFCGYYGSIFEDNDTSIEFDYINELREQNGLLPLENEDLINWDYTTYYSELNIELTNCVDEFLTDLGLINSITFKALHSPKYYNYSNDFIECIIDLKVNEVKKYINNNLEAFKSYLIDNFKSRDGFISFYEYDLNFWLEKMQSFKNLDYNEIHALLDFICTNENFCIVNQLYNVGMHNIPMLQASNFTELTENKQTA